jgi:hypothetical protein
MVAMIIFCEHDHNFCCGDGEKEKNLQKKLIKPNLNRVSHLWRGVIFYHLIQTSNLHHVKQGGNKVKFCHTKKMLMWMCNLFFGIDNGTQCNLVYEFIKGLYKLIHVIMHDIELIKGFTPPQIMKKLLYHVTLILEEIENITSGYPQKWESRNICLIR